MSSLEIIIFIPFLAALAIWMGAPARLTAVVASTVNLLWVLVLAVRFPAFKSATDLAFVNKHMVLDNPAIAFAVGADGVSMIMALLTVLVTFAAVWQIVDKPSMYHIASLLISGGALGAFLCTDLFFIYAFHEVALIPTFLMIGIHGRAEKDQRLAVAWKTTIYLGAGSLVLLAGLVWAVIEFSGGGKLTFDLVALRAQAATSPLPATAQAPLFFLLLVGFGTLVSLFPFHSWAAPAYATAPTPVAMLHSGVLKKFGLYGLFRIALPLLPAGAQVPWVQQSLLIMLLGNILVVGLVTLHQKRLDDMLANSSVMHMGYLFLGLAAGTEIAVKGSILLMFAHGISIALLFAICGRMRNQLGTLEMAKLGGIGSHAPFLTVVFAFGAFASIGLPGLANFAGEVMIFMGAFANGNSSSTFIPAQGLTSLHWTVILALWGVVISAVYMLRGYRAIFQGTPQTGLFMSDPGSGQWLPLVLLAAVLLAVGCFPSLLLDLIQAPLAPVATP
ncbi:MAG: NADH-quinone oxidoreductase subunit M [Verrucomicrobiaceae bacterium]|nr:NADH-quinone oxidoreductase subunit M [Verrucomicrobiaceae bacterium]